MKFVKENWKMLIVILLIVILFPSIILIASNNKLLSYNTAIAIIGYGGSILGGFLTLYGVWWTIKEQNTNLIKQQEQLDKQKRENFAIQYRPILKISVNTINSTLNNYKQTIKINIIFSSIGRGEACNINSKIESPFGFEKVIIENIRFIPSSEKTKVLLDINLINFPNKEKRTKYLITTFYTDSLNVYKYKLTSKIYITYDGEKIEKINCTNSIAFL